MSAVRIYAEDPSDPANDGTPPFVSDHPIVRHVVDWHQNNGTRLARVKSRGAEKERRRVWTIFKEEFGDRLVSTCRPFELLSFINKNVDEKRSPWTRRRWNGTIQAAFNEAEKLGLIVKNPFRGLTFPEGKKGRDWTDKEYQGMLRGSTAVFRRVLVAFRFSGLRPGEERYLKVPNVRFDLGEIVIGEHKTDHITHAPRCVPLNTVMEKLFRWLLRNNPPAARHLFLNAFGKPWTASAMVKRMKALRKRVGLTSDVKCHGGRHTFITRGLQNGVPVPTMMEIVGHRQMRTTQGYTHMNGKSAHMRDAMEQAVKTQRKSTKE